MHSIERYGIVALLFLVVTVVGVLMWDGGKDKKKASERVSSVSAAAPHETPPTLDADARARRLSLLAESQAGPLQRAQPTAAPASTAGLQAAPPATQPVGVSAPLTNEPAAKPLYDTPLEAAPPSAEPPVRDPIVGAAPTAGTHTYSVRAGDTLSEIAQRELGSSKRWPELVAANPGLDANKLRVGKKILVPGAAGASRESRAPTTLADASRAPATAAKSPAKASTWKVGKGENLWRIAERALGDGKRWHEIASLNPRVNPDKLVLGQVLVLPAAAGAGQTPGANRAAPKKKPTSAGPTLVASNAAPERASRRGGRVK